MAALYDNSEGNDDLEGDLYSPRIPTGSAVRATTEIAKLGWNVRHILKLGRVVRAERSVYRQLMEELHGIRAGFLALDPTANAFCHPAQPEYSDPKNQPLIEALWRYLSGLLQGLRDYGWTDEQIAKAFPLLFFPEDNLAAGGRYKLNGSLIIDGLHRHEVALRGLCQKGYIADIARRLDVATKLVTGIKQRV